MTRLRIATRKSPLAMWQAEHVRDRLVILYPQLTVQIIGVKTEADRVLGKSLGEMGGKGAFVKELETALLAEQADIAVHSMKDVPVDLPRGLEIVAILRREDPRDVFVSRAYAAIDELPSAASVGTSSLRRRTQLLAYRPDLQLLDIRGNIGTRLGKLDAGDFDGLVLAASGVKRLGLSEQISEYLATDVILPAVGQGALGIEARSADNSVQELLAPLNDDESWNCVQLERDVNRILFGGCSVPIAAYAAAKNDQIKLSALVGRLDGSEIIRAAAAAKYEAAATLGKQVAARLLNKGARRILDELRDA